MHIKFNTQSPVLISDDRLKPRPAADLLPDWKRSISSKVYSGDEEGRSARTCPALHDYLHMGYIIPLWTDMRLERVSVSQNGMVTRDPNGAHIRWKTAYGAFPIEFHSQKQVDGAEPLEPPQNIQKVVKPICPWLIETPKCWSILIMPLILHESRNKLPLQPIPGIVNTDHWHQIHTPCKWENLDTVMEMKAGTPFMHIIPFRRNEKLEAKFEVIEDQARLANLVGTLSDFSGGYRRQQKIADKKRSAETGQN